MDEEDIIQLNLSRYHYSMLIKALEYFYYECGCDEENFKLLELIKDK